MLIIWQEYLQEQVLGSAGVLKEDLSEIYSSIRITEQGIRTEGKDIQG